MSFILALLLVFSAGLAEPLHAAQRDVLHSLDIGQVMKDFDSPADDDSGAGESGETLGDPDGWLGGQNLRPLPPITADVELAPQGPGGFLASLLALFHLFLIL